MCSPTKATATPNGLEHPKHKRNNDKHGRLIPTGSHTSATRRQPPSSRFGYEKCSQVFPHSTQHHKASDGTCLEIGARSLKVTG